MPSEEQYRALEKRISFLERLDTEPIACRVYNNANFSHNSTGNWLALTFNSERRDMLGMHSTTSNQSRITFTLGGWYLVGGQIEFETNATGIRGGAINVGGVSIVLQLFDVFGGSYKPSIVLSTVYYFTPGDYIELYAYQNSGGNLNVLAEANFSPELWAIRLP